MPILNRKHNIPRRPNIVTQKYPEGNHFNNNKRNNNIQQNKENSNKKTEKPLILLVGDSTIKNVTSFDLRKECKNAFIMVRPYRGGKIKNIKKVLSEIDDFLTKNSFFNAFFLCSISGNISLFGCVYIRLKSEFSDRI